MDTLTWIRETYNDIINKGDPRIDRYFMVSTPWPCMAVTAIYVLLVTKIGPAFMKNREPFNIRGLMVFYNFAMVLLSGYICWEFAMSGWLTGYSYGCQPVDYSYSYKALRMVDAVWWFWFSKFIEMLDTIFFIARKKNNQVTFLHVFHHGALPMSYWTGLKFVPGGFGTMHAMINSFIHFVMYMYYGVAAMGPQYQKYLWWKKYMTVMQMTQFVVVVIHSFQLMFIDCNYPKPYGYAIGTYSAIFLVMFGNFYRHAYAKARRQRSAKSHANGVTNGSLPNGMVANGVYANGKSHQHHE